MALQVGPGPHPPTPIPNITLPRTPGGFNPTGGASYEDPFSYFRRKLQEQSAGLPTTGGTPAAPVPGGPLPHIKPRPIFLNPYHDIPGFEDFQHPLLKWHGDTPGKLGAPGYAGALGFPSHDRVQQISDAQTRMRGAPYYPAPRTSGLGAVQGETGDLLRKLLAQRMKGGAL